MSMVIAHAIPALNAGRNLYRTNQALDKSLENLSSGYRINAGVDGPADLVISERLRVQVHGLERAVRNAAEGANVLSIVEGALGEMNSVLEKMKALAVHAANSGVASPRQAAADQAEMDSGIQTLERIANTTRYSDRFLINASKDIAYAVNTEVRGTQNNQLVNSGLSVFNQIFKRDGYQVSFAFSGAIGANAVTGIGRADMRAQAAKAYLEIDAYDGTVSHIDKNGRLTRGQSFILTGTLGSRQFAFSEKAHLSEIVSAIKNAAGATGVDAALTFNRNQNINMASAPAAAAGVGAVSTAGAGFITMYDNCAARDDGGLRIIATAASVLGDIVYGKNTDGQGDVHVRVTGNNGTSVSYEIYKDAGLSAESLIGVGSGAAVSEERNNSGLRLSVAFSADAESGDVFRLSLGNIALGADSVSGVGAGVGTFNLDNSTASGVRLGVNTSSSGALYFKIEYDAAGDEAMVSAYVDPLMREEDKVAATAGRVSMASGSIVLDSAWNAGRTANTGLGLTLNLRGGGVGKPNAVETMELRFLNLGARIFSTGYGSAEFIGLRQFEGGLFVHYENAASYDSAALIEAGSAFHLGGRDAVVNVNGRRMTTNGLTLELATPDLQARIVFNSGGTGATTLAQVGYGEGSVFSKNTALTFAFALDADGLASADGGSNAANNAYFTALLNNAAHYTRETVESFSGGMRFHLGEGAGDQERTIIGIRSMSAANLGRLEVFGRFDNGAAVWETRTVSVQDVMGGQAASLSRGPELAMKIIEKAISEVSELRARLGAVQANMLQTSENNLRAAIENIAGTESGIRDADMAAEMTEFTKSQLLFHAGAGMLAQANFRSRLAQVFLY